MYNFKDESMKNKENLTWKHDGNYFGRYIYIGYSNVAHRSKY